MKKIGIITSGGDCAGLNAAIRAIVIAADKIGVETYGFIGGQWAVLDDSKIVKLSPDSLPADMLKSAGTILKVGPVGDPYVFKCENGDTIDMLEAFDKKVKELGIDAIIMTGGDGSFSLLKKFFNYSGIPFVAIPKTIDLDVPGTDMTIGFDTALNELMHVMDNLQTTVASHNRFIVVEAMGRTCGWLTMQGGIVGGADAIIVPEIPFSIPNLVSHIKENVIKKYNRHHGLIIVAEGAVEENPKKSPVKDIAKALSDAGLEVRTVAPGHLQRGGIVSASDRRLATQFAVYAVDLLRQGKSGKLVVLQGNEIKDISEEDFASLGKYHSDLNVTNQNVYTAGMDVDDNIIKTAKGLGIYIGEID